MAELEQRVQQLESELRELQAMLKTDRDRPRSTPAGSRRRMERGLSAGLGPSRPVGVLLIRGSEVRILPGA
jgi:hypothetical protein